MSANPRPVCAYGTRPDGTTGPLAAGQLSPADREEVELFGRYLAGELEYDGAAGKYVEPALIWPAVAGTGHRRIPPTMVPWVRKKLAAGMEWLRDERGTRIVISGMALGFDQMLARSAVDAGLDLWAYLPYPGQADRWKEVEQREWRRLVDLAADVVMCSEADPTSREEAARMLDQRNDAMLAGAAAASGGLIALYDKRRTKGGTRNAVRKAGRLPGVHLDPAAMTVRTIRPGGFPAMTRRAA